jgi:L-fucose isomerase-like protein
MDEMDPARRRDAFCGKFSIMDVFCQYNVPFTVLTPHVVAPSNPEFAANVDYFDRMCRVVKTMKRCVIGAVGARTTAFKTVRIDELALQKYGITVETFDLSDVFSQVKNLTDGYAEVARKAEYYRDYTSWKGVPDSSFSNLMKLSVVLDRMIEDNGLDAISIRCWIEMQKELGISPCVVVSELNNRNIPAACEVDTGNAIMMQILSLAAGSPSTLLDWNNNYGDEQDKCILFHCGPVPQSMMTAKGQVTDHAILKNVVGEGCSFGCNVGRIKPADITFGSLLTVDGSIKAYIGTGEMTSDTIPEGFFGCAGVARIDGLQEKLRTIGCAGYRHHVALTTGHVMEPAV